MKKMLCMLLSAALIAGSLAGCGSKEASSQGSASQAATEAGGGAKALVPQAVLQAAALRLRPAAQQVTASMI